MKKQGVDRVCKFRGICGEVQNGAPVRGFGPPPAAVGRSAEASAGAGPRPGGSGEPPPPPPPRGRGPGRAATTPRNAFGRVGICDDDDDDVFYLLTPKRCAGLLIRQPARKALKHGAVAQLISR